MRTLTACKDAAEVSCLLASLIAELEMPCGHCRNDGIVLTGQSPAGKPVTVRLLADNVLEIEGGDGLLDTIKKRGCPHG